LPIVIGGRAEPALRRAGRTADGYQSSSASPAAYAERVAVVRAAAEAAGRPAPWLSARTQVRFGEHRESWYAMHGSPEDIAAEVRAFAALGVEHIALGFGTTHPAEVVARAERFATEVVPLV
jgi:alkanesulfonate monooxygenase SsuD/methylene tetrahydromethanopterin reductase-like flavin-dependent oxidoreductase (luciferase family)